MSRGLMFAALLAVAGAAVAEVRGTRVDLDEQFAAQREAIQRELGDGETFVEIEPEERAQVLAALDRMSTTLERAGGVAHLDEGQKVALFNDQELVNAILTRAGEDSRLVCRRERRTGSHRVVTHCMTVEQRRKAADNAQDALRQRRPGVLDHKG